MPASFKQRAMLIDEIWHAAGDRTAEIDWYIKRAVLGGIYSASEIFMLTDNSPGFKFEVLLNKFTPKGSLLYILILGCRVSRYVAVPGPSDQRCVRRSESGTRGAYLAP